MADNAEEAKVDPFMDEDEMVFWGPVSEKERQIHARLPKKTTVLSPNSRYRSLWQPNLPDENQAHGVIAQALEEDDAAGKEADNPNQEEVIISSNVIPPEMVHIVTGLECLDLCENIPADLHLSLNQLAPDFVLPKTQKSQANPTQDRQSSVSSLMKFSISSTEGPIRHGEIEQAEIQHSQSHSISDEEHEEAPSIASEEDSNEWNAPVERDLDDNDTSNDSGSIDMNDTIERMERLLAMAAEMERENNERQEPEAAPADIKEEERINQAEEKEIPVVKVVDVDKPKSTPAKPPRGQKPSETPKQTPIARKSAIAKTPYTQLSKRLALKVPKRNAAPQFATPKPPTKPALNMNRNRQMHCANPHLLVTPSPKAPKCTAKTKSNMESKFVAKTQSFIPLAVGSGTAHDRSDSSISSTASGSSSLGIKYDLPGRKPTYQSQKAKAHLQSVQSPIGRYIRDENQPTLIKQIRPKLKKVASNRTPYQESVRNSKGDWSIVTEAKTQAPAEDNKENRELLNKNVPSLPIVLVESAQGSIVKPMIDPKAPGVYGKMEKLIKGKQNPMVIQHFARVKFEHQSDVTTAKSLVPHSSSPAKEIRAALLSKGKADVCVYSPNKNRPTTSDNSERNLEVSVLQAFSAKKTLQKR